MESSSPLSETVKNVNKRRSTLPPQLLEPEFFPECWKTLLNGVVAYVDCRTGSDNRSKSIILELQRLGATCVTNFSKKVTHLIFKDGSKPIYDKAKKAGIPIISYLWVVACKEKGEMVPVDDYKSISSQDYDSEFFKWRKTKSMQPKDLEEELKLAERRLDRKRKKKDVSSNPLKEIKLAEVGSYFSPPVTERRSIIDTLIESSPMVQERIYQEFASGKTCEEVFSLKKDEEDDFDTYFDTPLMIKFIAKNYYSPHDPQPLSLRKILSEVQTPKTATAEDTARGSQREVLSTVQDLEEDKENISPMGELLRSGSKRKKTHVLLSSAKKVKPIADSEDLGAGLTKDKLPRKKLFRPRGAALIGPEDVVEAKTPQETPVKSSQSHPCFSQVTKSAKATMESAPASPEKKAVNVQDSPEVFVRRVQPRRDSMADFRSHVLRKCHNDLKGLSISPKPKTLVCTSLHTDQSAAVCRAVEALNGATITETVDDTTSHVVCGDSRRTLNVMRAVIRGAKLVTFHWVLDSAKDQRWLDEDRYEVARFAERAAFYRRSKKNRRLFDAHSAIYVSPKSTIPHRDLSDLIGCAGGRLASHSTKATLIIGRFKAQAGVPCVNGTWVLDCIEQGTHLPLTSYLLTN